MDGGRTRLGPDALLSHHTAAALWGIRGYSGGAIHVTVPRKSTSSKRIRRHLLHVPPDERTEEEGIPVTSVHRTIFDLAATVSVDEVIAMIKEAEYRNLWDRLSLWDLLDRYPAKRGSRNLRFALKRITEEPRAASAASWRNASHPSCAGTACPYPASTTGSSSAASATGSTATGRARNQIVELDGWEGHSTRTAFQDDRARDRASRSLATR